MKIYPVEKNVPSEPRGISAYPFSKMDVNDSFKFEGDEKDARTVRSAASMHAARTGTKFSIKRYESGYRCWRIS